MPTLYPDTPARQARRLAVSHGHVLHVQEWGPAQGLTALVLHGGPGSGCSPLLRRYFDPARYRVICVDQRGAGLSEPAGDTAHNTTAHLLQDLQALRQHLGVQRWLVVGGSWGATLALAYAAHEPQAISALLLRSVFLARTQDIDWFFQGAAQAFPQAWHAFAHAVAPDAAQTAQALLAALTQQLHSPLPEQQQRAALAWRQWEMQLATGHDAPRTTTAQSQMQMQMQMPVPVPVPMPMPEVAQPLVHRYRIQAHYLQHGCWLNLPNTIANSSALPTVPTLIVHSRNDAVCLPEAAQTLHASLPHSQLRWVEDAGHDAVHPHMVAAMVQALDHYAQHRHFGAMETTS